jgi:hypothetical protein
MIVYVAMIADRHTDPEPYVFTTAEAAIAYAKAEAVAGAHDPSAIDEEPIDGWLYYARYGEDSSVWVIEKTIDDPDSSSGATT